MAVTNLTSSESPAGRLLTDPSGCSHPEMKSFWEVISPFWLNPSRTTL
jgi:hypothetical protein